MIELRPFGNEHFDGLIAMVPTEATLVEWCGAYFRFPLDHAQLERYVETARQPSVRTIFAAEAPDTGVVGHVEISHIWPHLSSRLSRVLIAPGHRRRGIGTQMVLQALSLSFREHHVAHIDLGVSARNASAIGCYRKIGFKPVGTWPNAMAAGSHIIDVRWMSLTRRAWQKREDVR